MKIVGLTGSIGMGKTTTAQMFKDEGCAVFDADAAVHKLYAKGGAAVPIIGAAFPDVIVDGAIDRGKLSAHLRAGPITHRRFGKLHSPLGSGYEKRCNEEGARRVQENIC